MPSVEKQSTLRDILLGLRQRELLDEAGLERIGRHLARQQSADDEPWFVKLLLAVGAWIAAICFVAFLAIANMIKDDWSVLFGWGITFLIAATVLRRLSGQFFLAQLALAFSSMGHGFVIVGAAELGGGSLGAAAAASLILCLLMYPLYPDNLHRFLSCGVAAGLLVAWIVDVRLWPLIHLQIMAEVIVIAVVFVLGSQLFILRPLGYAMAIALPATLLLVLVPEGIGNLPWWPANIVLACWLVWLYQWAAGGWASLRTEPMMVAVAATVCLATFTTPGILAAVGLMVLGYARNDRYLLAIGLLFFPVFIVVFYYEWQITLLMKSWIMAGSGLILLLSRWFLGLRGWAREQS